MNMDPKFDKAARALADDLKKFIADNEHAKIHNEIPVYSLSQAVHELLEEMEISPEERGCLASIIIEQFIELNKEDIALYNEQRRYMREIKDSTVH